MDGCLLCLEINIEFVDSIKVDSKQWQEQNIKILLEKHFWSMDTIKSYSWLCTTCWQELYDFHKFYSRVEEAHVDFGRLIKKEESICQLQEHKDTEASSLYQESSEVSFETERLTECYLEPEILIDQPITPEETNLVIKNEPTENLATEDIIVQQHCKRKRSYKNVLPDTELTSEDPLEKCKTSKKSAKPKNKKIPKSTKNVNSLSSENQQTEQPTTQIKQDPDLLDINTESDLPFDCDANDDNKSDTDSNYDPDSDFPETTEQSKSEKKTYYKHRTHRKENDKFIAEHFKEMHCDICQIPLENFPILHKHFSEKHNQKGYVICCTRKFFGRSLLVDHIRCHLNPDHFKCNQCGKILSDHLRLERHIKNVHGEGDVVKKHCCDVCGKSFAEAFKLRSHKLTHLPEEEKMFPCTECGKSYASAYNLNYHTQAVHLKKFIKICHICGKSLSSSSEYKTHMDKHEGKPPPQISCDVCGLRLTCERGLKRHKEAQHPEGGKKDHYCPICPKVSPTLKALKKHINTMHEKGHEYKCTICERAFKRKEALNEHMASHTGTALYTCPWCPKTFNSNGNMHAHRKKIHRREWEEAKLQKYSGILPQQHKLPDITKDTNDYNVTL